MRYTTTPTHWICCAGVPVFYVPRPEIAKYAEDQAEAERDHAAEALYIAQCLNAGRQLPR